MKAKMKAKNKKGHSVKIICYRFSVEQEKPLSVVS